MSQGGRRNARAATALALLALLLPWGGAHAVGGLLGQPAGPCADTVEGKVGEARLSPYTEDPGAGAWRTWLVAPGEVYVPPPPSALSERVARERAELALLAAVRTPQQEERARWWDAGPAARAWEDVMLGMMPSHTAADPAMNPPRQARALALFEAAMHDALVIAWKAKYCFERAAPYALDPGVTPVVPPRHVPSYPSEHAVAAGVASVLLPQMFPLAPQASFDVLVREATESRLWAGANYRSDVEAGLALGQQVARLAVAARAGDGSEAVWKGTVPKGPCVWSPLDAARPRPVEPLWGQVRPWLMERGDQFRPAPPPACDSPEYVRQTGELHNKSRSLTSWERHIATYYEAGPGNELPPAFELHWAKNLSLAHRLTTMQHARAMSHVAVAVADAGIAAWDAKYAYWSDRPAHAIHRYGWDANWTSLVPTPNFPGYISGHATFAGAAEVVLAHLFPKEAARQHERAEHNALSRFLGGVHIQADNDVGLQVGRQVGQLAVARLAASA